MLYISLDFLRAYLELKPENNMTGPHRLLTGHGLLPKKHMGQNFLSDPSTAEMIVRKAGLSDAVVLEIGAGVGALTGFASLVAKRVYAVEKDRDLIAILQNVTQGAGNVNIINNNIFDVDINKIYEKEQVKLLVIGNLPYNISSQVIVSLIFQRQIIKRAVLMLQTEMARRIYARTGTKEYGRLSVMTQYCADVCRLARVGANQFYPRPRVDSEVIEIRFVQPSEKALDENILSAVVKAAFGQRRKTLKNALSGGLGSGNKFVPRLLEITGIDGSRRAETLSVKEFVALANEISRNS
jgi:16S rRNA (adenine1518-N6/adenine1519-N6)-dimethyltransferase